MSQTRLIVVVSALAGLLISPAAGAATNPQVAGLQVALRAHGLYAGPIDGIAGPGTAAGTRAFQARAKLQVDGIAGIRTRTALGRLGTPLLGRRILAAHGDRAHAAPWPRAERALRLVVGRSGRSSRHGAHYCEGGRRRDMGREGMRLLNLITCISISCAGVQGTDNG